MIKEIDERMLALKAALWENGDIDSLLSKAIRSYLVMNVPEYPKGDSELYINGQRVVVKGVPHVMHSNEMHENILLMAAIEDMLEGIYQDQIPTVVEFSTLLN